MVVPGAENFKPENVCELLRQVELLQVVSLFHFCLVLCRLTRLIGGSYASIFSLQDQTRMEVAWEEMVTSNKTVDLEELALVCSWFKFMWDT